MRFLRCLTGSFCHIGFENPIDNSYQDTVFLSTKPCNLGTEKSAPKLSIENDRVGK